MTELALAQAEAGGVAPATADDVLSRLHCPPDVETSHERFKTSCGHAAIAALVGCNVADVWHVQQKPYTSPTAAEQALRRLGAAPRKLWPKKRGGTAPWPRRGIVIVQIDGPWTRPEVPIGAAYKHMHCIATFRDEHGNWWVYDHNIEAKDVGSSYQGRVGAEGGGWLLGAMWKGLVMQQIVAETKRATGWWARASFEVAAPAARTA